jgi:hypothetical protein
MCRSTDPAGEKINVRMNTTTTAVPP